MGNLFLLVITCDQIFHLLSGHVPKPQNPMHEQNQVNILC